MLPALQPTLELAQRIDVNLAHSIDVNLPTLALASGIDLLSPEKTLAPLNAATEPWVRAVVWTDFRVAVALFPPGGDRYGLSGVPARAASTPADATLPQLVADALSAHDEPTAAAVRVDVMKFFKERRLDTVDCE